MEKNIKVDIGDFLGFVDMNGMEALTSDKLENLENFIREIQKKQNEGESLVSDAIYDRLMDILREKCPDSELATQIWEDSGDDDFDNTDDVFINNPMYSIQTVKSFDCKELMDFIRRLPDDEEFDAHVSFKENGFGIRLVYVNGRLAKARTRARSSAGRDITAQLEVVLGDLVDLPDLDGMELCEIRGELVMPMSNMDEARRYNPEIKSPFTAVSSMSKDSATPEMWGLLRFVAYDFKADDFEFYTKEEMYNYIEDLGFETPSSWLIEGLTKETILDDIKSIVEDCEGEAEDYEYYTDGLVFEINQRDLFDSLGDNGSNYKYGNIALKVGYWKQDMYSGFVQTIVWMRGTSKLSPVAIIADEPDMIEFEDFGEHMYVGDIKEISNYKDLGVLTAGGNKVRRVPLYEPSNILALDATRGNLLCFRYGGEAGVVPCFPDGTTLIDGRVKLELSDEDLDLGVY